MHRPLPRTMLAAATLTGILAGASTGAASAGGSGASTPPAAPSMTPIRTDVRKLSPGSDASSTSSVKGGQSALRAPKSTAPLGRKLK